MVCPQCGTLTEWMQEGVCEDCCLENQADLDAYNAEYDAWTRLTDAERERRIRDAMT